MTASCRRSRAALATALCSSRWEGRNEYRRPFRSFERFLPADYANSPAESGRLSAGRLRLCGGLVRRRAGGLRAPIHRLDLRDLAARGSRGRSPVSLGVALGAGPRHRRSALGAKPLARAYRTRRHGRESRRGAGRDDPALASDRQAGQARPRGADRRGAGRDRTRDRDQRGRRIDHAADRRSHRHRPARVGLAHHLD